MVCLPVREIIHSLKLIDFLLVHADKLWYKYYIQQRKNEREKVLKVFRANDCTFLFFSAGFSKIENIHSFRIGCPVLCRRNHSQKGPSVKNLLL